MENRPIGVVTAEDITPEPGVTDGEAKRTDTSVLDPFMGQVDAVAPFGRPHRVSNTMTKSEGLPDH